MTFLDIYVCKIQFLNIGGGTRRRLFMKELRCTLYGYGDDQNPYTETVEFLDDLVLEFITDFTRKAMEIGRSGRVQVKYIVQLATL